MCFLQPWWTWKMTSHVTFLLLHIGTTPAHPAFFQICSFDFVASCVQSQVRRDALTHWKVHLSLFMPISHWMIPNWLQRSACVMVAALTAFDASQVQRATIRYPDWCRERPFEMTSSQFHSDTVTARNISQLSLGNFYFYQVEKRMELWSSCRGHCITQFSIYPILNRTHFAKWVFIYSIEMYSYALLFLKQTKLNQENFLWTWCCSSTLEMSFCTPCYWTSSRRGHDKMERLGSAESICSL